MRKPTILIILLFCMLATVGAQSIWDSAHLAQVKASLQQPAYATAYKHLLEEADGQMKRSPLSVMLKEKTAASGDKHDYLSLSRYFWPDPTKPDGLPYINRDGVSNPELEKLDRPKLAQMAGRVTTLSLAWYFSGEERYAQKAVEQLQVWFLNKETRMNPNLNYAQIVPGLYGGKGRCYGVIDSYSFVEMLDAVQLLEGSKSFTPKDSKALKAWFSKFLQWILTSSQGIEEGNQKNNHATAHDVQVIAYAKYVGNKKVLNEYFSQFYEKRLLTQIELDGRQPYELRRTLAFGYSQYNLTHIIDVMQIARHLTPQSLSSWKEAESMLMLGKAADFLAQYVGKRVEDWPYQQISEWDYKQNELCKDLYRLYLLDNQRTDYLNIAKNNIVKQFADRFFLLYYTPDETDNAFAEADVQLRFQLEQANKLRRERKVWDLMPRCVEKDGSLRMVRQPDWCCGFFSGELWQMYQYSHDYFWREQAVSNTWPIEQVKLNGGSHDLGFMVYNSFGKAWELTGEQSYRDVVVRAAQTLITRYDDHVGCIRSWSWGTPDRWKFAVIIDNMINLELLFQASLITGDKRFYNIAVNHANTTMRNHFRDDMSSYHVVDYDPERGNVIKRITHQGLFDESVWSRGQGWGLYGFTMCYRYTHDKAYLEQARKIARFWFSQEDMPDDLIPWWDMRDPAIKTGVGPALDGGCPRDASAAAIIASALYELATFVSDDEAKDYREKADKILHSLETKYQPEPRTAQGFLLLHSTGNYPSNDEIDVPINYADYYYLEAQLRKKIMRKQEKP